MTKTEWEERKKEIIKMARALSMALREVKAGKRPAETVKNVIVMQMDSRGQLKPN